MPEYDFSATTVTDLSGSVSDVKISAQTPDAPGFGKEVRWNFPDASKHLGYYNQIPELKSALHILAQRVAGLGYNVDPLKKVELERINGWGEDTFTSIMMQLIIEKKVFGDAFAEIIRNDNGTLINIKKLYTGDMAIVMTEQGLIDHYEQFSNLPKEKPKKFKPEQILHLCNDRMANEVHGTSVIDSLKFYIDFYLEMLKDERMIRHRELALGILEVDTDDPTKISAAISKYQDAVKKGEVLVLPKGLAEIKDNPNAPRDRLGMLQFIISQFYQVIGTPKILTTSEGYTEAGGKAGLLAFEPTEISEKLQLEEDLWNQLAVKIKFTRTPSLLGEAVGTEQKNAGQTGIQPNETQVRATRTE